MVCLSSYLGEKQGKCMKNYIALTIRDRLYTGLMVELSWLVMFRCKNG